MKKLNIILVFIIGLYQFSCSTNNETPPLNNELIGIWLKIDSDDTFEERYTFNSDQTGNISFIQDSRLEESIDFTWSTENNILTVITGFTPSDFAVPYEINSKGQLILDNDSSLIYNKIE